MQSGQEGSTKRAVKAKPNWEADCEAIAELIKHHFGESDHYARVENVKECSGHIVLRGAETGAIEGYLIYEDDGRILHGVRSGLIRSERGKGLSLKLYKKMIAFAKRSKKPYQTYTSKDNLHSINSHVRAGMRIVRISDFVYMST